MPDLLARASAWLDSTLGARARQTGLVYRRGGASVALAAVIGRAPTEADAAGLAQHSWQVIDFLIAAEDLVLAGVAATPQDGDLIEWTRDDGTTTTHEVQQGPEGRSWGYTDETTRQTFRVHTRQIV